MGAAIRNSGRVVIAAAALAALAQSAPAVADQGSLVGYNLSVDVDYPPLDPGNPTDTPTLTNVVVLVGNTPGPLGGNFATLLYWTGPSQPTDTLQPILIPASDVTQTLALNDEEENVYSGLLLAIGPTTMALFADFTDASNVQHVVVGMDPTAAAAVAGQSFADTFPSTSFTENDLDNAMQTLNGFDPAGTEGDHPGSGCGDGPCGDAQDVLGQFADQEIVVEQQPLFRPVTNFDGLAALPGSFDLVSYSDGAIVGSGAANLIPVFSQPTVSNSIPEPSTWAMMLLGFAGLGYAGYRRSRSAVRPFG